MLSSVCEMIVDAFGNGLDNPPRMNEVASQNATPLLVHQEYDKDPVR